MNRPALQHSDMSQIITEAISRDEALAPRSQARASIRWIKRVVLLLILLWIASEGASLAIQHTRLRRTLTAYLQSAFGRPVEVGSYDFSVLDGFALEANSVTVGEDLRFGQEYFLRADSITLRLRWASLLRGRVEFGTVSLQKPSLNLVRNSAGEWNLAQWLPRPAVAPTRIPVGPAFPSSSLRFGRVEVEGGRINFKDGDEKLPFALLDVKGTAETDRPGRWRVNFEVQPWRAALVMQQTGTIRLSGDFGGTSSRLLPATLDINWSDASLSDVLRLAKGDDDGVRGLFALQANAHTDETGAWVLNTRAQIQRIRRWDLVERPDSPSLAVNARIDWTPAAPFFEITQASLDAPHSHASVKGRWYWRREAPSARTAIIPVQVAYADADLDTADLLASLRAFHPGVADNVAVRGFVHAHTALLQWPPRIISADVSSRGAELSAPNLRHPARLGELQIRYDKGATTLAPVALSFGSPDDALRFESAPPKGRSAAGAPVAHLTANVSDVHDVLAAAGALGWNLAKGWDVSGPARADLRWQGNEYPWRASPVGFINWGAGPGVATVRVPFLNLPIGNINATSEWKPGSRHTTITSAEAFGAHWTGALDRAASDDGGWKFSLAADHLAAADLDRWMNPAWRESFLGRVLPFLSPRPVPAAPENLEASGRLTIDQLALAPLAVRKLQGDLLIDGRHVALTKASGQFYGGQVSGTLDADLAATPAYRLDLNFSRVDGASLVAATPALAGVTAKTLSGQLSIRASGANRGDLISSVTCQGSATAGTVRVLNIEPPAAGSRGVPTEFPLADASFSCAQRRIVFQRLGLTTGVGTSEVGTGSIDFSRNLDLRFQSHSDLVGGLVPPPPSFSLIGTLAAPRAVRTPPPAQRPR